MSEVNPVWRINVYLSFHFAMNLTLLQKLSLLKNKKLCLSEPSLSGRLNIRRQTKTKELSNIFLLLLGEHLLSFETAPIFLLVFPCNGAPFLPLGGIISHQSLGIYDSLLDFHPLCKVKKDKTSYHCHVCQTHDVEEISRSRLLGFPVDT